MTDPAISLMSRRTCLHAGGLSLATAFAAPNALAATSASPKSAKKSCIVFFLDGGSSHHETFDPKPLAPKEVRGEFGPIATTVPGMQICELLPHLAKQARNYSIVRSLYHGNPSHAPAEHQMLTGWMGSRPGTARAKIEKPSFGSIVSKLAGTRRDGMPAYVAVPWSFHHSYGGSPFGAASYLGPRYAPFESGHLPKTSTASFQVPELALRSGLTSQRLRGRRSLLGRFNQSAGVRSAATGRVNETINEALDVLLDKHVRTAFDLTREPQPLRSKYGNHEWGQAALLSRRLVEAGTTFVMLQCGLKQDWDTHDKNFSRLKNKLLPAMDKAVAALIEDLEQRQMLDETLVLVIGDFGRTPKINKKAGRDHWAEVFSAFAAGGGIKGGQVVGSSDRQGGYPKDNPLHAQDFFATMYHLLGIDHHKLLYDRLGRPIPVLSHGKPIEALL